MRLQTITCLVLCTLAACQAAGLQQTPISSTGQSAAVTPRECEKRVNDTIARLEACIARDSLWRHLLHFQAIADANPGSQGHPNRDTGTLGYAASVAYVAKLMRAAGYRVSIQRYTYRHADIIGTPILSAEGRSYELYRDWYVARLSGGGTVDAAAEPPRASLTGCSPRDFAAFDRGSVALLERGGCDLDTQVTNARAAGAAAAILYDDDAERDAHEARLIDPAGIPVIGVVTYALGTALVRQYLTGNAARIHVAIRTQTKSDLDYNVIADSPYGDPHQIVVLEAHLDAIYGAGMLDNASGSTTILETALALAKTPARNRLRYIWFGGEELGLLGSRYYTTHLTPAQLHRIVFDVDADVTATPNFDILIADPQFATKAKRFPKNVVPESKIGNDYFADFFKAGGIIARPARFGNDGTDSFAFSLAGVPNSGILTQQDCCKHDWEVDLWGGVRGNYEGKVPGFNGGCVDYPHRWCDNLDNNDAFILELTSKAVAFVTFELSNHHFRW
ncbi:MAG TPA: M28 family peptidase [Candidatus Nitrosotalea sp.]|nr:M28 family peptidase [Candidatus Nitrosotalea sp.]